MGYQISLYYIRKTNFDFYFPLFLIFTTRIKDLNDLSTNKSYKIVNIKDEKIWKVNF